MTPNLGERRHFDTLDTLHKIQILISKSLGNLMMRADEGPFRLHLKAHELSIIPRKLNQIQANKTK